MYDIEVSPTKIAERLDIQVLSYCGPKKRLKKPHMYK